MTDQSRGGAVIGWLATFVGLVIVLSGIAKLVHSSPTGINFPKVGVFLLGLALLYGGLRRLGRSG